MRILLSLTKLYRLAQYKGSQTKYPKLSMPLDGLETFYDTFRLKKFCIDDRFFWFHRYNYFPTMYDTPVFRLLHRLWWFICSKSRLPSALFTALKRTLNETILHFLSCASFTRSFL